LRKLKLGFFGKRNLKKIYVSHELEYNDKNVKNVLKFLEKDLPTWGSF
jgi:hypothetical protein